MMTGEVQAKRLVAVMGVVATSAWAQVLLLALAPVLGKMPSALHSRRHTSVGSHARHHTLMILLGESICGRQSTAKCRWRPGFSLFWPPTQTLPTWTWPLTMQSLT